MITTTTDDYVNLVSSQLGAQVVFATDEWFAAADNMLQDSSPAWKADLYTKYGKWMDGWESRRRRTEGHDWSIIKLGLAASRIHAIEVDTAFFTGNFSPKVSVYGIYLEDNSDVARIAGQLVELRQTLVDNRGEDKDEGRMGLAASQEELKLVQALGSDNWPLLVPLQPLGAGYEETRRTIFQIPSDRQAGKISHLRINMGPDGGIARVRVYGEVYVPPESVPRDMDVDLCSVRLGGRAIGCSNAHYGHPRNLIAPGRGTCMGDGWETARQPNALRCTREEKTASWFSRALTGQYCNWDCVASSRTSRSTPIFTKAITLKAASSRRVVGLMLLQKSCRNHRALPLTGKY